MGLVITIVSFRIVHYFSTTSDSLIHTRCSHNRHTSAALNESQICCGTVWFRSFVALMTAMSAIQKQQKPPNYWIYSGLSRCHWMMVCLGFDIISCQCFVSFAPEPFLPVIGNGMTREKYTYGKNNYELKGIRVLRWKDKNRKNSTATRKARKSNGTRDGRRMK